MLDFIVNPSAGGHHGAKIQKALASIQEHLKQRDVKYVIHFDTGVGSHEGRAV